MGWANCGNDSKGRPIGYGTPATCDHPDCTAPIDRGLAYACGGMHGASTLGGDGDQDWSAYFESCEGYFCETHLTMLNLEHEDGADLASPQYCMTCADQHNRSYRHDEDCRSLWPTSAPPLSIEELAA